MASTDPTLAHRYGPSPPLPPSRLFACHSESDLQLRGLHFNHLDNGAGAGSGARSNGASPVTGSRLRTMEAGLDRDMTSSNNGSVSNTNHHYQHQRAELPPSPLHHHNHPHPLQQHIPGVGGGGGGVDSLGAGTPKPIRRRMRMITSCLECRRRKLKCNKSNPCTNCLKFSRDCLYLGPKLDEASQLRLTEIKEKVGSLERQLERDVAKSGGSTGSGAGPYHHQQQQQQRILADDVEGEFDEERDLEITPMVALDLTYEDDADGADDIMDLGVQVGKMRLTEKIGGLNRPRISEEIQAGLSNSASQIPSSVPGQTNNFPGFAPLPPPQVLFSDSTASDQSLPDFLRPSASYIPPTSGVFFGQVVQSPSLLTFLPTKSAGDRLLEYYFIAVHPIARCVHRPSLELQYESFWEEATAGYEPRASVQAVVFAAWFSAAVAMEESVVNREVGFTKANLVENMKIGTEVALSKANFLRTTRVDTMQAFVMYMIPLCRDEVSRAHSVLVGAAVRMAECMGLNRDGSKAYNLNPLETHVRRLIWHQLCFLDIRTCEAQGPKPAIRREDYDTWLPDNCEEDQLATCYPQPSQPIQQAPPTPSADWTSTLPTLIRFEINEMMRVLWTDRRKLEARRITLTEVLTKIENFRKRMLESYDSLLDERIPLQRYAKIVMHLLLYRLHVMILHPYYANTANPMPARLRSVLITSAVVIIELATQLDTHPAFAPWRWYAGAYQQYHSALVLATEMFYHPHQREAQRIWACLDYVFELDGRISSEEKGRQILVEIMGKMGIYMSMRKMRAPTLTASASPAKQAVKAEEAGLTCQPASASEGTGDAMRTIHLLQQHPTAPPPPPPQSNSIYPPMRYPRPPPMKEERGMVTVPPPMPSVQNTFATQPPTTTTTQQMIFSGPPSSRHETPPGPFASGGLPPAPLWSLPPPQNADSPDNSSSDGGSVMGVGSRLGATLPPGVLGGGVQAMDGDWSNYQEDAINALFAGFGDSVMGNNANMSNESWAQPPQSQPM